MNDISHKNENKEKRVALNNRSTTERKIWSAVTGKKIKRLFQLWKNDTLQRNILDILERLKDKPDYRAEEVEDELQNCAALSVSQTDEEIIKRRYHYHCS